MFLKQISGEVYRYSEIDIDNIEIENKSDDKLIKVTDPLFNEKEELIKIQKELKEMKNKLQWSQKQIPILNNPKNKDPNKNSKLVSINEFINSYDDKKNKLKEKETELLFIINEKKSDVPYIDSFHLFRHLRNSISHGRFIIDYETGYNTGDIGDATITFYDVDDGDENNISNASVIIKMSFNRFEKLSKDLSKNKKKICELKN